jgi:release factor glutamine methyltransferase
MTADLRQLLREASDLPLHEAERLLMAASGLPRAHLAIGGSVAADVVTRFRSSVARRRTGEPLQYIEGSVHFGPLELAIDRRALIPRPETEQLWELAVARCVPSPTTVVDLCTGSGNLALACKHAWPGASVFAVDVSDRAAALARHNARRLGLDVIVLTGDLFDPLPRELLGQVDLIVANPPYLAEDELPTVAAEVRDHEPTAALVAGPMGDEVLGRIAGGADRWLRPGALIAVEISEFRATEVVGLFAALAPELVFDLAGKPRFVVGSKPLRGGG